MDQQLTAYTAALAVIMPVIVAFVVQSRWRKRTKRLAVLVGGTDPTLANLVTVVAATIVASQVVYHTFWKPTGLLPALEKTTDVAALKERLKAGPAGARSAGQTRGGSTTATP